MPTSEKKKQKTCPVMKWCFMVLWFGAFPPIGHYTVSICLVKIQKIQNIIVGETTQAKWNNRIISVQLKWPT